MVVTVESLNNDSGLGFVSPAAAILIILNMEADTKNCIKNNSGIETDNQFAKYFFKK